MKNIFKAIFLLLFIVEIGQSQTNVRYFFYDNAGNRVLRKDHLGEVGCPATISGYTKLGEFNGHAYFMSNAPAKWVDAKVLAENEGGYLATMNDQAENDWLQSQLLPGNNMVFIGYNDEINESTVEWANNETVTLDLGYENNATNDYGLMNFWAGTWQMVGPWQSNKFILEMDCGSTGPTGDLTITCPENINVTTSGFDAVVTWSPATAETTCSVNTNVTVTQTGGDPSGSTFPAGVPFTIVYEATDNCSNTETCSFTINVTSSQGGGCGAIAGYTLLDEYGGHGYYLSTASTNWAQANTLAQNDGGYLATMNDQAENDFLQSKLNNNMVFIGYNDAMTEGVGQWANNEQVTLDLSYDNNTNNDFAVMNFWAGTWQMVNQWVNKRYVLEKSCSGEPYPAPMLSSESLDLVQMILYPNPTSGIFTIQSVAKISKDVQVYLYNGHGRLVLTRKFGDGFFDISHFATGTYLLLMTDGQRKYKINVVKGD